MRDNPIGQLSLQRVGRTGLPSRALGTGGGSGPVLLPLSAPWTSIDNSYGAQGGSIDVSQYTDMGMGCRGLLTMGAIQARGGDRISHANDRLAPAQACCENGAAALMNIENDLADAAVTADIAGGDVMLARASTFATAMRAKGAKVIAFKQGNTTAAIGAKAPAVTRYNSQIASLVDLAIDDPNDYQNAADSSDSVHPNKAVSASRLGFARGTAMKALYVAKGVFDDGGQIAGNFNANWNMGTAPTLTNATSGATAVQAADVLRSLPGNVPCRRLTVSGTVTADPTASGSTGDIQLRFSTPHLAGTNTYGKSVAFLCYIEITDSAGNDPVGLATVQVQCGSTTCFGKQMTASHGPWNGGKKYQGPLRPVRTAMIGVQSIPMNTDFIVRGLQQVVDIEVRIAYLNVFYTDETQYYSGSPANASAIFTAGRPVLFALPTTTPTTGPLAVGGTLGVGTSLARLLGGGLTRTYDAIRGGTTDVGDMTPVTAAGAAVPYTVQAGDAGSNLLARTTGTNAGGSASADSAALSVP